jgi:hypothetical protein
MPDAKLKDMAERMALIGEAIILNNGGEKIVENGEEYYLINTAAKFVAPLELPGAPTPYLEVGQAVDYSFYSSGGAPPLKWAVISGDLPDGIQFETGKLSGVPLVAGVYPIEVEVTDGTVRLNRGFDLIVRGENIAPKADEILATVTKTVATKRDAMWLTVGHSLYTDDVAAIRDGKKLGEGSTFYSISHDPAKSVDYYGYRWAEPQVIGVVDLHMGSMEENGGWFTSLDVQFLDAVGQWQSVEQLITSPKLLPGKERYNKAHFVEYVLIFSPVETSAIRIIGDAGGVKHWRSELTHFTSVTELSVHGALPDFQKLNP